MTKKDNTSLKKLSVSENNQNSPKDVVDEISPGILSCDREGNITSVNDFFLETLCFPSVEDLKNINILTYSPLADSGISATIEEAIKTGKNLSLETTYRSTSEREFTLRSRAFPRKDVNGQICGCYTIIEELTDKRIVGLELAENEEILRRFIEYAPVALIMMDRNLKNIAASRLMCESFGVDNTDIMGKYHYDVFPQIDNDYIRSVHQRALKGEAIHIDEGCIKLPDGSMHWSRLEVQPWKEADGTIGGIIVFAEDITERKNAEALLLKKEKEYEDIIDSLDAIIWKVTFDSEGNALKTYVSKPLDKLLGFPKGTIGDDWNTYFAHIHVQDFPKVKEEIKRAFKTPDSPLSVDYRVVSYDGKVVWMNSLGSAHPLENGFYLMSGTTSNITNRKLAEEEVIRNEQRYRNLIEQLSDAVIINTFEGQILEVNNKTCEMLGYSRQELQNMMIYDLMPPERRESAKENMSKFIRKGSIQAETKFFTADGKLLIVEVNAKALEGYHNTAQAIVRDVTERKMAEEELKRREEKYRSLFEQSNDAVFLNAFDGQIIDVNEKACEMFGYTKEEFRKMAVLDLLAPDHVAAGNMGLEDFKKTGTAHVHSLYVRANGETFDVEVRANVLEGYPNLVHAVVRDISKIKKAEEELIRSENKYRSLFEKSNDSILIHDVGGKIVDANKKTYDMLGYSEEELLQKSILDIIVPDNREDIINELKEIQDKDPFRREGKAIKADGNIIHVDVSVSLIKGRKNLVMAVARDITDRIKSEEAMLQAKVEAETASKTKSEFLTIMSHELRTPLNSIIGFSDILLDGVAGELEVKQQHYLQHVSKSGHHLLKLINDILDISRIEAGKMQLHFEMVNVNSFIDEVVSIIQSLVENKSQSIIIDIPEDIPDLSVDKAKFKQIMLNLLGNAVKFTDNGGTININCRSENNKLIVSVTDTGIGISKDDQNKLFKPFSQIDSSIARQYEGTGLGLALVKEIIELHQGQIWVESESGKGSSFIFELPTDNEDKNKEN